MGKKTKKDKQIKPKHPDDARPTEEEVTPSGYFGENTEVEYDPEEYNDLNTFYETNE